MVYVVMGFFITYIATRQINAWFPHAHLRFDGIHVHHYVVGIFLLTLTGCLALDTKGVKVKIAVALLHGIGMALVFDEFSMLVRMSTENCFRQSRTGGAIATSLIVAVIAPRAARMLFSKNGKSGEG